MIVKNADSFEIDLTAKNRFGKTGLQIAEGQGRKKNINIIERKMPQTDSAYNVNKYTKRVKSHQKSRVDNSQKESNYALRHRNSAPTKSS